MEVSSNASIVCVCGLMLKRHVISPSHDTLAALAYVLEAAKDLSRRAEAAGLRLDTWPSLRG